MTTFDEKNTNLPPINLDAQPSLGTPPNRGLEVKKVSGDPPSVFVTLMQIDKILIDYLTDVIKPTITDNERTRPVPIVYASPERWKTIRKDGFVRDTKNDKVQTPLIALRRTNIQRSDMTNPSNKYLYLSYENRWDKRNAYDRFAVQNGVKPTLVLNKVMVPDYVDLTYQFLLWTEYQEQMNMLIEQINVENEEWWGLRNQYKFRVRIDNYDVDSQLPADNQRFVRTTFNMKVSAYLVPERMIKNFNLASTNTMEHSIKKIITISEVDRTGDEYNVEGYYNKLKSKSTRVEL